VVVDELLRDLVRHGFLLVAEFGWLASDEGVYDVVRRERPSPPVDQR
jgi:hypothetical protein